MVSSSESTKTTSSPLIALTGASGFVGHGLAAALLAAKFRIRALVRDPEKFRAALPDADTVAFQLAGTVSAEALRGVDTLIHCAYALPDSQLDARGCYELNIRAAKRLLEASRAQGVRRFIFISSFAAHPGAESFYGRGKREIEGFLDPARDLILQPGLVIGNGGLYARMAKMFQKARVFPLFYGGEQRVQTISLEDLGEAVVRALRLECTGLLRLAEPRPVPIMEMYLAIAESVSVKPWMPRAPGAATLAFLRMTEALRIPFPLNTENLLGLKQMVTFDTAEDLKRLGGLELSDYRQSVARLRG